MGYTKILPEERVLYTEYSEEELSPLPLKSSIKSYQKPINLQF